MALVACTKGWPPRKSWYMMTNALSQAVDRGKEKSEKSSRSEMGRYSSLYVQMGIKKSKWVALGNPTFPRLKGKPKRKSRAKEGLK